MNLKWELQEGQIFMLRPDLGEIQDVTLPNEYFLATNTDEMLPDWVELLNKVFGDYTINRVRYFIDSPHWNSNRVKLIKRHQMPVALSVAWHELSLWPRSGHVLWVAVLPGHQGQGIGSYLLSQTLRYFVEEGLQDAVVYTEESRLPAVKMYLKLGFVPLITETAIDEMERWKRTFNALGRSELIATVRNDYDRIT